MLVTLGGVVLWKSGHWLVYEDTFEKVPWALVLAGESRDCERTDAAIKLYHEGRIDTIVLSACRIFKTHYQSEYMVDYVAEQGVPRGNVFEFRQDAYSTLEEARLLVRQFRLQNLDTVLIITSNYHTARTRRIFRKLAQGYPQVLVYPAEFPTYNPAAWWSNRESMKYWFNEWIKTFATYFELARTRPESGKADFQNLLPDIWSGQSGTRGLPPSPPVSDSVKQVPAAKGDSATGASAKAVTTSPTTATSIANSATAGATPAANPPGSASNGAVSTRINGGADTTGKTGKEEHPTQASDSGSVKMKSDSAHGIGSPAKSKSEESHADSLKSKAHEAKASEAKAEAKAAAKDSAKKAITNPPAKRTFPRAEPVPKAGASKGAKKPAEKTKKKSA